MWFHDVYCHKTCDQSLSLEYSMLMSIQYRCPFITVYYHHSVITGIGWYQLMNKSCLFSVCCGLYKSILALCQLLCLCIEPYLITYRLLMACTQHMEKPIINLLPQIKRDCVHLHVNLIQVFLSVILWYCAYTCTYVE